MAWIQLHLYPAVRIWTSRMWGRGQLELIYTLTFETLLNYYTLHSVKFWIRSVLKPSIVTLTAYFTRLVEHKKRQTNVKKGNKKP